MRLAELQEAFQQGVLDTPGSILAEVLPSQRCDSAARFGVYAYAYRARLSECLGNDYPVTRQLMGEEDFADLAAAYLDAAPSQSPNARWFGDRLPTFLTAAAPWCEHRLLVDLARFEWAMAKAFDAADATPLDTGALLAHGEAAQPELVFTFAPSLTRLAVTQGLCSLYESAMADDIAWPADANGEETVLIFRDRDLDPVYRVLEPDEDLALAAAASGASLKEICAALGFRLPEEEAAQRAAAYLGRWFADGLITRIACR